MAVTEIVKLIQRKGLKADLPTLDEAEFGFATDTKELFVGSSTGNILIAKHDDIPVGGGSGSGTTVADSGTNGYILVDGVQLQVYDDTALTQALSGKADVNHGHTLINISDVDTTEKANGYVLTYNSTTAKTEFKALPVSSGGSGSIISDSATNGNILVDGSEVQVYDDTAINSALAGKEPSFTKKTAFNKDFGTTSGTVAEGNAVAGKANLTKVLKVNIPALPVGDFAYCTDTRELFIGTDLGNQLFAEGADVGSLSNLTTTDRSSIVNAINEIKMSGGSGGGSTNVSQEAYSNGKTSFMPQPTTPKAYMSFIDDDAKKLAMDRLKPIVEAKGVPIAFAVPVNDILVSEYGASMTQDEVLTMQSLGCEIMSHSYTHPLLTGLGASDLERELGASKKALIEKGYNIRNVVYPSGASNDLVRKIAGKYYNSGYGTLDGVITSGNVTSMKINRVVFGPFQAAGNDNYAYYKSMLDTAIAQNGWVIFNLHAYHTVMDSTHIQWINDLIDYAKSLNVAIVNPQDGYDIYGNIMEVETKLTITKTGEISTPNGIPTILDASVANDAPLTSYKNQTITVSKWLGSTPLTEWGTMFTFRYPDANNHQRSYQQVFGNTGKVYSRRTISATDPNWGSFTSDISTYTYNLAATTVAANSFVDIQITHPNASLLATTDAILAMPSGGLENGLIFNTHLWSNKVIILRLHNFTASSITTAAKNWFIHVVKTK